MPNLIARADGNWTDVATWALTETGTGAQQTSAGSSTNTTASYVYSPAFTGTNTNAVDGLLLLCRRLNTTGTVSVALSDDNGVTATREVTVNASDLPTVASWVFFRFGAPLTLDGGTDYRIGVRGSSSGNASFSRSATAADWTRLIRRTAAPASLAAGDDFFVAGEFTAAATYTSRTVTMDNTSTTRFGGLRIAPHGTVAFGTAASTSYNLHLGTPLNVYPNGTLNIGTDATPVPRSSTARLDLGADAVISVYGAFTAVGESRTSGNSSYHALLDADWKAFIFTVNTSTEVLTLTANGCNYFSNGDLVRVGSSTTLPGGLSNATDYYVINAGGNTCQLSATLNGSAVNITSTGSGTHRIYQKDLTLSVDTDTGWLGGDQIGLAPTSRTPSHLESGTLNGNAGAGSLTVNGFAGLDGRPLHGHSGTSPTQGEVVLLTRNVTVSCGLVSTTTGAAMTVFSGAAATWKWAQFVNIGNNSPYGLVVAATGLVVEHCVFREARNGALQVTASSNATTVRNNVFYNNATLNAACAISATIAEFSGNIGIGAQMNVFNIDPTTALVSNNRAIGNTNDAYGGILLLGTGTAGTISGNVCHSNAGAGMTLQANVEAMTIETPVIWHNGTSGLFIGADSLATREAVTLTSPVCFGNVNNNLLIVGDDAIQTVYTITDPTFAASGSFGSVNDIRLTQNAVVNIYNGSLSEAAGSGQNARVASTNGFAVGASNKAMQVTFVKTGFGAATEVSGQGSLSSESAIRSTRHNKVSGAQKAWFRRGTIQRDTAIFNTASPSERVIPNSAAVKVTSGARIIAVDGGTAPTVSAYVRKSVSGDGAAYNGSQPRLIARRNDAVGIAADTVLDTMTAAAGSWEQLIGTLPTMSEDGGVELCVDCDGTAGWINIDDWAVTV